MKPKNLAESSWNCRKTGEKFWTVDQRFLRNSVSSFQVSVPFTSDASTNFLKILSKFSDSWISSKAPTFVIICAGKD